MISLLVLLLQFMVLLASLPVILCTDIVVNNNNNNINNNINQNISSVLQKTVELSQDTRTLNLEALGPLVPNIDWYRVAGRDDLWYVNDFLSSQAQQDLVHLLQDIPATEWYFYSNEQRYIKQEGHLHRDNAVYKLLPPWLQTLSDALVAADLSSPQYAPNMALLNRYHPEGGFSAHKDGDLYHDRIFLISVGTQPILLLFRQENDEGFSVLLNPRSVLAFEKDLFWQYTHAVPPGIDFTIPSDCINVSPERYGEKITRTERWSISLRHTKT
jgi:alkylated DNA repair dioxygenase AlkB